MRRWLLILMFAACSGIFGQAQEKTEFPTADALETLEIPRRDRVRLAQELLGVTEIDASSPPVASAIGDRRVFNVNDNVSNTNTPVEAELIAEGEHIAIWLDTRTYADPARAATLVNEFDSVIYPKMRAMWGSERTPGIDGDARVIALFTYDVGDSIAAYYASEHSLPRDVAPESNEAEMMVYNLGAYGADFDSAAIYSVTSHEFQHMIRDNIPANAPTWLNEGMSVFSEWLMGYETSGPVFMEYLFQPRTQLNSWQSTGANYGTAGLFITYFFERFGVAGIHALSQSDGLGMLIVEHALERIGEETDVDTLFADWVAANWLRDDGTIYGYQNVTLFEPASVRIGKYPHTLERHTPPYATDFYTLRDLPAGATLTVDVLLNPSAALISTAPASGEQMWTAVRQDDSAATLTHDFDLRDLASAALEYRVWYDLESRYDFAYLNVSTDGGQTWDVLDTPSMAADSVYGAGYTGQSGGWIDEEVSLDAYAGQEVLVRFMVITDDALNNPGMALDDIRLDAAGYATDLEDDDGGWESEGWLLTDNRLPAHAWVQVLQRRPQGVDVQRLFASATDSTLVIDLFEDATAVALAISPIVPISTEPVSYTLNVAVE